jgi:hypothetical protein
VPKQERMSVSSGDVRATKIEIYRFCGDNNERRDVWKTLCQDVQEAFNCLWRYWLVFHTLDDTAAKLRQSLDNYRQWVNTDKDSRGNKPKWEVDPLPQTADLTGGKLNNVRWPYAQSKSARKGKTSPPDLQNDLYHILVRNFPRLTSDQVTLILQKWAKSVKSRKSANSNLPGWAAIVLGREAAPSFTKRMPIPFTKRSCPKGVPLRKLDNKWILGIKLDRQQVDSCDLLLHRKKAGSQRAIVERIMRGEYAFMGSAVQFDETKGKWFAIISYRMPEAEKQQLDDSLVLVVRPGRYSPWRFSISQGGINGSDSFTRFGHGRHVEFARRNIISERISRSEHYRFAGSNSKGHGRQKGDAAWTKLTSRWKDFVKRYNNEVTKKISEWVVDRGIGTVVFIQPKRESVHRSRFLSWVGNDSRSSMSWEYFQFASMLQQKCGSLGVDVVIRQQNTEKTQGKGNRKRAARKPATVARV